MWSYDCNCLSLPVPVSRIICLLIWLHECMKFSVYLFLYPFSSVTPFLPLCTFLSISVCLSITQTLNLSVFMYTFIYISLLPFLCLVSSSLSVFKSLFLSHTPRCLSVSQHIIRFFLSINVRICLSISLSLLISVSLLLYIFVWLHGRYRLGRWLEILEYR